MKILDLIFSEMVGQPPLGKVCELKSQVRQSNNYARVSSLTANTGKTSLSRSLGGEGARVIQQLPFLHGSLALHTDPLAPYNSMRKGQSLYF